ncbi:MAG: DUF2199 domain-containing protein [Neisseria sp.]|uniref:DUF2199 domain-containing protein n=1 Tax=Neisseria TaxID=482 RepID=UPI00066C46C0|nr:MULTISPECIES: DUF2199 domain-containing protein [Neisseria]MBF1270379.1 DUF2199 domain-containing protein [Neisseria sp.]OHR13101.1 hypothetical protein HMPREF2596_02340 [Neisseria sp. HMSC078C12]
MYTCTSCGENHEEMPAIGFITPDPYNELSEDERSTYQAECNSDFCIIRYPDQTDRFIRTVLHIPIIGHEETLEYGVWVSVSEKSFNDYKSHFHDNSENVVYFGMICNWLPPYETNTFGLHCNVVTQSNNQRPLLQPHQSGKHPLIRDFYQGIECAEAQARIDAVFGSDY